jgi:hypothetical protein
MLRRKNDVWKQVPLLIGEWTHGQIQEAHANIEGKNVRIKIGDMPQFALQNGWFFLGQ